MATTFSLVIVFLPVSFLSSQAGRFLFQFGITASVAILVSLLVSFTLTPMMCARMLRAKKGVLAAALPSTSHESGGEEVAESRRGFYHYLEVAYDYSLRLTMRHRWVVAVLALAVIAANVPLYYLVPQDYIPTNVDEAEFEVSVTAPEGASLAAMDRTLQAVEGELREINGVVHLLTTVGSSGLGRINTASIYVRLEDIETRTFSLGRLVRETLHGRPQDAFHGNWSQRERILEARRRLAHFHDLRLSIRNLQTLRGTGAPVDIDFVITGPDLAPLARISEELRKRAEQIPGIVDVDTTLRLDKPELHVAIDRERAAALGVDAAEIAESLRIMVGGEERVSRYRDPVLDDVYDVELRLAGDDRGSKAAISQLYVRSRTPPRSSKEGEGSPSVPRMIRLDNVVQLGDSLTPARIDRLDRQKMVAIRANIAPGYALADRVAALRGAADEVGLPPGYTTRILGRSRELERTLREFGFAFILSLIFMYIILAAQFEHLVHPFTILFSLPLAVPFGLLSLWLGGETLNLYSALGILVLFGVVKKNSILQVDHINQLRAGGMNRLSAILQGNRDRLRPILMTTLAFVAGMLPLVIGTGPGAEERRSIAVLVLGGQTLSLLLTLLATPVVYSYLDDVGAFFRRRPVVSAVEPIRETVTTNGTSNGTAGPVPTPREATAT
jgi:HAE1 family hydrophobic/amphiphilic exporter-1